MAGKQPAFWAAVALLPLLADPVLTLVADSKPVRTYFPALGTLNDFRTKKNG